MPVGGGVICRPVIAERGLSGASYLVGLTEEGWHSQTTCTAMPGKLWFPRNRGKICPKMHISVYNRHAAGTLFGWVLFRLSGVGDPVGFVVHTSAFTVADLCAVKALVWTTKPTGSPTPESRKSTQPKRVPAACLLYTEMCIFGHICPPISRKPEFSRHSGACGLRVPPFYCKTH